MLRRLFRTDTDGSVAPLFAISLVSLVGAMGIGLDYSRASLARTRVLAALDATALALARDPVVEADPSKLQARATLIFEGQLKAAGLEAASVSATISGDTITVTGSAAVATTLAGVLGYNSLPVSGQSEVRWGTKKIDLVLALDNTGSMNDKGKMKELKKAAVDLINTFDPTNQKKADTVRIGIVPFTVAVRVPAALQNTMWYSRYRDDNYGHDEGADGLVDKPPRANWTGCVVDRQQPHDTLDTPPSGDLATKFPSAVDSGICEGLKEIQPLTTNFGQLRSAINSMAADGWTNVTIGLAWAWHVLSPGAPGTEGRTPNGDNDLLKVVILLTDGDNTRSRFTHDGAKIDERTQLTCNNIKAAGMVVYTVRLIEGNATLLRNCASDPGKYYNVTVASQLAPVFGKIAAEIGSLRISK